MEEGAPAAKRLKTDHRAEQLDAACKRFLRSFCGPGDVLEPKLRASVASEAVRAVAQCPACEAFLKAQDASTRSCSNLLPKVEELNHRHEKGSLCSGRGLVGLVHTLANLQTLLDKAWMPAAVELVSEKLGLDPAQGQVAVLEILVIVAGAVGVRGFYACLGQSCPELPEPWTQKDPLPKMSPKQFPTSPFIKLITAPVSAKSFQDWMEFVYVPGEDFTQIFKEYPGRGLKRHHLEILGTTYAEAVKCAF